MLKRSTKHEAIKYLMDEDLGVRNRVYFKEDSVYRRATDYGFVFGEGGIFNSGLKFHELKFYIEYTRVADLI